MFDIFDLFDSFQIPDYYMKEEKVCPVCGRTYSDFAKTGKLGCSECYKTFANQINYVLKQIHQNPAHCGKIPPGLKQKITVKRKLEMLKNELREAVSHEEYEKAAKLHKEILDIEKGGAL